MENLKLEGVMFTPAGGASLGGKFNCTQIKIGFLAAKVQGCAAAKVKHQGYVANWRWCTRHGSNSHSERLWGDLIA